MNHWRVRPSPCLEIAAPSFLRLPKYIPGGWFSLRKNRTTLDAHRSSDTRGFG
jgi:hypothetical protein